MSEFEELVDAHYQALYRFGMSLTRDSNTAADLVQETFCIWAAKGDQLKDRTQGENLAFHHAAPRVSEPAATGVEVLGRTDRRGLGGGCRRVRRRMPSGRWTASGRWSC